MKEIRAIACLAIACTVAWAGETSTMRVMDTAPGPLLNSGQITVSEAVRNGQLLTTRTDKWKVRNVSGKNIVAFVESMHVTYPSGRVSERTAQHDAFFHPDLMRPGQVLDYSRESEGVQISEDREKQPAVSACAVTTRWVQFSDGTTWGDDRYATELMHMRQGVWSALVHLRDVYQNQGQEEFLAQLNRHSEASLVDVHLEHLRLFLSNHSAAETFERVQLHLKMATQRAGMVTRWQAAVAK